MEKPQEIIQSACSLVSTSWYEYVDQFPVIEVNVGNIIHVNVVNLQLPNSDTYDASGT
jgi:hypothetical protein